MPRRAGTKGFVRLADVHFSDDKRRVALEKYLAAHSIDMRRRHFEMDNFTRYMVRREDLCCAQAGLLALREVGS